MSRICITAVAIAACASLLANTRALAEQPRAALIVGNATYTAFPGIVGCARSANAVTAALRALQFQITDRQDPSTGGIDAGISEFSQNLADSKSVGFVYVCGYATDFNNRTFLLPTTARIGRPSDVMTQGILARSLLTAVSRDPATTAVVVFDMVPQPDGPARIDLDALTGLAVPEGVAIIAATEATPAEGPTPVAAALVTALAGPRVRTDELVATVRTRLTGSKVTVAALHAPLHPGFLAGAPPPPAIEPRAPPSPAVVAPPPVAVTPPSAPVAVTPAVQLPDDAQMTEFDRRTVQVALIRLGYYDRAVDAVFGPETRAAIRRYQHEIGGELTGRLTAEQASRLANSR